MLESFRYIILLITILLSTEAVAASDPYGNCVKSYDFGGVPTEGVIMAPITPACQALCVNECGSFSRKNSGGLELNAEAITNCLPVCQAGNLYTNYVYEEISTGKQDKPKKLVVRGPFTSNVACTGVLKAADNIYKSTMKIAAGDKVRLTMVNAENANKIYLCGKKLVTLDPLIDSLKPEEWNSVAVPQTVLEDRRDNMCAVQIKRDSDWNKASNRDLWGNKGLWSDDPRRPDPNERCLWNARHQHYTSTDIWAKDGDELSISWKSTYIFNASSPLLPGYNYSRLSLIKLLQDPKASNPSLLRQLLLKQGSLLFLRPGADVGNPSSASVEIMGEGARLFEMGKEIDPQKLLPENQPASARWFGLRGTVIDLDVKTTAITTAPNCDTEDKRIKNYSKCYIINDPGISYYSFKGILGDGGNSFSKRPALLALKHFRFNVKDYENAVGGSMVTVEWNGCPFSDGQMLQYAVSSEDLIARPDKGGWADIPAGVFKEGDLISIAAEGNFYLRIKPLAIPPEIPKEMQEYYTNPAHRFGQYYINLSKQNQSTFLQDDGIIKQIVNSVRSTLYGEEEYNVNIGYGQDANKLIPAKKGVTRKLYEALVEQSSVIDAVRAALVLFMTMTGFGYLVGTLQMNQKDMVTRLVKLAIVATVISPGSWDFFANNFFKAFIDGGLELIGKVVTGSLGDNGAIINITKDPASVFSIFDGPFRMLFNQQTGFKIVALIMSGMLGIVVALFVGVSAVFYFLSIAKVILMFLMSMVIISLLIFMTPLFLCFMLFQQTQNLFNSWWKMLISFTLQPVALFASIAIFNLLIVITLFTALGFTACPSCLFAIYIPGIVDFCLLPVYRVLAFSHFPDQTPGFFLPAGVLEASVLMLILTQGMYRFCEFIANVTNMIVMGGMINVVSLGQYGGAGIGAVQSLYGGDDSSKYRRQMAAADEQQKKVEQEVDPEKRKAEEKRIEEEKRIAEEKLEAEENRKAEERRLAEERRIAEENRLIEERRRAEARQRDGQ